MNNFANNTVLKVAALIGVGFIILLGIILAGQTISRQTSRHLIPEASPGSSDKDFSRSPDTSTRPTSPTPVASPTPLQVISTTPLDQAINVYPGELDIEFKLNQTISSGADFSLEFNPKLEYYYRITSDFPTDILRVRVFGGLRKNTKYSVSLLGPTGDLNKLEFTTSNEQAESSSSLVRDIEEENIKKYTPLIYVTPYNSANFDVIYTDDLTLKVTIKNSDVEGTKQQVLDWIRANGVEPNTHTINYIVSF